MDGEMIFLYLESIRLSFAIFFAQDRAPADEKIRMPVSNRQTFCTGRISQGKPDGFRAQIKTLQKGKL